MKKVLFIATVSSFVNAFLINNIKILHKLGYEIHIAVGKNGDITKNIPNYVKLNYLSIQRSPSKFRLNYQAYKQLLALVEKENINLIDCHTPIGGLLGRLVSKNKNIKCIYTAHGFHFYKGAPLKNWILFYLVEKWLSRYTDVLITINKEDYQRAKEKFHMKCIEYVPGVGINIQKFELKDFDREAYRRTLGLSNEDRMLLSIGELNENKNHQIVIKALGESKRNNIHFFIAGEGNQKDILMELAKKNNIEHNVHLLGHRNDINKLLHCADIFIHPSKREGLPVALMEAMVCEVPCIVSNIRGNVDLIDKNGGFKFAPNDVEKLIEYINILVSSKESGNEFIIYNRKKIKEYSMDKVNKLMNDIYHGIY